MGHLQGMWVEIRVSPHNFHHVTLDHEPFSGITRKVQIGYEFYCEASVGQCKTKPEGCRTMKQWM